MTQSRSRRRLCATLLAVGALFLLGRTIMLVAQGMLAVYVPWVSGLLFVEMALDAAALAGAVFWWQRDTPRATRVALRTAAAVALVHVLRVLVFVLGRTGPWVDLDLRPEARAAHVAHWTWPGVYVAGSLSVVALLVVVIIWRTRRHASRARPE